MYSSAFQWHWPTTIGPRRATMLRDCIAIRFCPREHAFLECPGAILGAPLAGLGRGSGSPGETKRRVREGNKRVAMQSRNTVARRGPIVVGLVVDS